jgi:hypothetical protein
MDFFVKITKILQKSPDFFLEIFKIHRLVWIFLWIFGCCVVYKIPSDPPPPLLNISVVWYGISFEFEEEIDLSIPQVAKSLIM